MGGEDRRGRQRGHDVVRAAAGGVAAQKKSLVATERDDAARPAWRLTASTLNPADLVFVDETNTHTALTRRWARAPRGQQRAVGRTPRNHGPNMTLLAALTPAGIGPAVTIPGAVDGPAFIADAERVLAPSLRPGQIVVLDNLSAHKRADAYTAIEAIGCRLLFLPASSPDVNPIELAFAKGKERLRAASERTPDGLFTATSLAIDAVSAVDARGFSAPCGFPLPPKYYANHSMRRPAVIRRPRGHRPHAPDDRSPALAACARSARGCGRAICIRSWTAPFAGTR